MRARTANSGISSQLYTPEQRLRRDTTRWTLVQGLLAPVQFAVFLISLALVLRYLATGEGYGAATTSIIAKTGVLYLIMVTGSLWEHAVFGKYLLADAFYWEDIVSFLVIALHTLYVVALAFDWAGPSTLMLIALAAYASYIINAAQFLIKFRMARRDAGASTSMPVNSPGVAT